jgi:hypothetical protein
MPVWKSGACIGGPTALRLAQEGASVVICDLHERQPPPLRVAEELPRQTGEECGARQLVCDPQRGDTDERVPSSVSQQAPCGDREESDPPRYEERADERPERDPCDDARVEIPGDGSHDPWDDRGEEYGAIRGAGEEGAARARTREERQQRDERDPRRDVVTVRWERRRVQRASGQHQGQIEEPWAHRRLDGR